MPLVADIRAGQSDSREAYWQSAVPNSSSAQEAHHIVKLVVVVDVVVAAAAVAAAVAAALGLSVEAKQECLEED